MKEAHYHYATHPWGAWWDSNPRISESQSEVLTAWRHAPYKNTLCWICFYMVGRIGFEPMTNRLKVYCSTNWANVPLILSLLSLSIWTLLLKTWPALRDSNSQLLVSKTSTLIHWVKDRLLVPPDGNDPPTPTLSRSCSTTELRGL